MISRVIIDRKNIKYFHFNQDQRNSRKRKRKHKVEDFYVKGKKNVREEKNRNH